MKKYTLLLLTSLLSISLLLANAQVSFASTLYSNTFNNTSLSDWTLETGNNVVCDTSSGSLESDASHACIMDLNTSFDTLKCVSMDIDTTNTTRDDYFLQTQGDFNNHGGNWMLDFQPDDGSRNIVLANGLDSETATASINTPTGVHNYTVCQNSGTYTAYLDNSQIITYTPSVNLGNMVSLRLGQNLSDLAINPMNNVVLSDTLPSSPTPTPTPTPAQAQIVASPANGTETVGQPFNVTVAVNGGGTAFNAAQATVGLSSNLSITGIHSAPSPACNFQDTQTPTTSDPSFAGAIYGSSSTNCNVYTLTLTPNAAGTGTITFTNGKIKAYADNSDILSSVVNGSFTINAANATPTPTPALSGLTVTSPTETYNSTYTLTGTKDANTTTVFVNGSSTGVTYPTSTTWQATETLTLGANNTAGSNTFTVYGTDSNGNQTGTISTAVSLHELGDINGDGNIDLTDASLFAVDWGKTSNLTYPLSDMNDDGNVDLTDLSILAKLIAQ